MALYPDARHGGKWRYWLRPPWECALAEGFLGPHAGGFAFEQIDSIDILHGFGT